MTRKPIEGFYPDQTKKINFLAHLEELRRRILWCLLVLGIGAGIAFLKGNCLMLLAKRPLHDLANELIFISPTEAFIAYIKVCLLSGFVVCFPIVLYHVWAFLSPALSGDVKRRACLWLIFALLLFFAGVTFSYFVAIPAALKFLIGFGEKIAAAKITLGKYISFFGAFILIGGMTFEIPVLMTLFVDAGFLETHTLKEKRPYAILAIFIVAAIITPTQDILNMLIFAFPMILLYEVGIFVSSLIEYRKK